MHGKRDRGGRRNTLSTATCARTRTMYFRVPERLHDAICAEAKQVGLPMADVLRRIFEDRYRVRLIEERPVQGGVS